ncbi:hypothetical protein E9549_20000 [Blastococcus sp. MG754426]|uniref:hypothetical protein n=1 Tax=unclassified Blastococcus TaxID=2619396 RepID=UPI001EF0A6B5|nr:MULTISPECIES: hypothetical protein [unclassified Blastococcus]MCF6509658.1 hypothetical protein [Blastococcus sp. MG754426]MCF6510721.1 hypothetical protein [Blastococcus sp. MG754427]MCF6737168.1 hypothetical protein [Blastococcus sp. KM273129]
MTDVAWTGLDDDWWDPPPGEYEEDEPLGDVLAEAVGDGYADADAEDFDAALAEMMESLTPAEAVGLTRVLRQIGRTAGRIASDPAVAQVAATVLPAAGGAIGTAIGGPVGTAVGANLGAVAARALPAPRAGGARAPARPQPQARPEPTAGPQPRAAAGSSAAVQGMVLTQHPDVLRSLLALALGRHGRRAVNGVPVAALLSMLSTVFGRAAADADELMYLDGDAQDEGAEGWYGDDDALYTAIIDADNAELAEVIGR